MEQVKSIINKPWFRAACTGAIAALLFFNGSVNYAFLAIGFGIRELLLAFKS